MSLRTRWARFADRYPYGSGLVILAAVGFVVVAPLMIALGMWIRFLCKLVGLP